MDHQPDVQKQPLQEQHQRISEQQNIIYIQQNPQNYRNQNYPYHNEGPTSITGNQSFQDQNASFGQFENHYPFVTNGHFSSSNPSTTIISNSLDASKSKNVPVPVRNTQYLSDNDSDSASRHQRNDAAIQFTSGNFQSVDLQGLNYQQASPYFLQNLGNHYRLNNNLIPTYQSSGSSESSDESSISNASQLQYSSDSSGISNNQFEFPVPIPAGSQVGQNFHQFQQKDFLDNYMAMLHQDTQVPRCDSSKSEAAESTCSSLSSGSTESQSENENVLRLPLLVNPLINNNANCNILHSYQSNIHNNISSYSNPIEHNENNEFQKNYANQSDQSILKYNNFNAAINPPNLANENNYNINNILPTNNQVNNLVVMLPNRMNKSIQNCLQTNQPILQNPSSQDVLNSSKIVIQNPKVNQQKIFGLINVTNPVLQEKMIAPVQVNQTIKVNSSNTQENCNRSDCISNRSRKKNNSSCGMCHTEEENNGSNRNCSGTTDSHSLNHYSSCEVTDNCTSHIQNTSDSSVINSNFVQSNLSAKGVESENDSAMLLKETSDKSISQCVSDVNSSVVDSNSVYLVKHDENNIIKNNCYDDSSTKSCFNANSGINALPVPIGWRRLLVDGSIIYLSPTNIALSSIEQVKMYLQTMGTCKCGLECPVNCDSVFNFNPKVISRPWDSSDSEQTQLCNHKRKAPSIAGPEKNLKVNRKEVVPTKRKKKKNGSSCSGVSVSQLLAQRDRALAAAAARWSTPGARSGNVGYQNMVANQYQSIQVVKNQTQLRQQIYENNVQPVDTFKRETPPARVPDDRVAQFPCINVINNSVREGTILNINGMSQLLPENHSTGNELLRSSQVALNPLANQRQEVGQGVINHAINYNQCGQEFVQNSVMTPKPEGVVLAPQGMLFPPNMIMQRPRSIPPWHQTRLNKKPVPESPVVYEKVPYIQQHMPPPALVLEDVSSRKKHKSNSKIKKASQDPPQNQPSFMENPSAYLAQQTALLHNTISRPNFNILPDTRSVTDLPQNLQNSLSTSVGGTTSTLENSSNLAVSTGVLVPSRSASFSVRSMMSQKVDQSIFTQSQVCQKNVVEKESVSGSTEVPSETNPNRNNENFGEVTFNNHVCSNTNCSDCKNSRLFDTLDEKDTANNQQINEKIKFIQESLEKSDTGLFNNQISVKGNWRGSESSVGGELVKLSVSGTEEESNSIEENPVTSSTEKAPSVYNQKVVSDLRPIQGGTVSTSNGSPQPQSSPSSSNTFRQEVSSPKHSELTSKSPVVGNVHISSTNSYIAVSNNVGSKLNQENEQNLRPFNANSSSKKESVAVLQALQTFGSASKRLSDGDLKHKLVNRNVVNVTTSSDQNIESNSEGQEEQGKAQSVTSSFDDRESQHENTENIAKGNRYVRTMASSHTASSNTITSVQAGRTQTATVTVSNNSSIPPTTMSLINLTNPNLMNVQVAQKTTKSPLEMVQSVVSSIKQTPAEVVKNDFATNSNKNVLSTTTTLNNLLTPTTNVNASILAGQNSNATPVLKTSPGTLQTGHILVSSNGQYLVASNGNIIPQTNLGGLKLNQTNPMPPMSVSPVVSNVTGAVTQVLPAVGVAQQVLGQSTVLVNALPAPFVIQPGVMAVETGLGRLAVATGNVLQSSVIENNTIKNSVRNVIPPEKIKYKKGNKKRKNQVTSLVQMASPNNVILNQPFGPPNFAVSPGGNVQPLQALTLVQGKHGQIVMNNQNNFNQFNSQPQQINLLQPVNLTSVPNFPAFQQFIVPGLGNMVMSTDGTTTILPDTTNIGVQLQLQNVNGQNVLTPVQNTSFLNGHGILTTPTGMFIRAPNNQQKIIQNNASPQFLSPNNSQFLVNQFQGQLSPLIATNLSPNQQIFTSSPQRQSPQEFIQIIPTSSSQNTTVVQQNTTIVQQQTTMVSNNQNILNNAGKPNFILSNPNPEKSIELQIMSGSQRQSQPHHPANTHIQQHKQQERTLVQEKTDFGTQHSVSTQTSVSEEGTNAGVTTNNTFSQTLSSNWSGSPPDTTTHSPVESESNYERAPSPAEEGPDNLRQAMVQYVSSSINETDSEAYLLPGIPKTLTSCETRSNSKAKNIVESSTILQETGVQIQIGSSYMPSDHLKSTVDDCVVSSHSDVNAQEKHIESQSSITSYQEDKLLLVDALLAENKPDDLNDQGTTDLKEKLSEGDLVWGPVRGSPAWPGKLVGPISPGGKALVRWFGGHSSPTRVNVSQLQSLSQGLDAHHRASNKGRKNKRLNAELEAAIQEAMLELDRMTAQAKKISTGRGRPRRLHR